jgi:hypothetical protein
LQQEHFAVVACTDCEATRAQSQTRALRCGLLPSHGRRCSPALARNAPPVFVVIKVVVIKVVVVIFIKVVVVVFTIVAVVVERGALPRSFGRLSRRIAAGIGRLVMVTILVTFASFCARHSEHFDGRAAQSYSVDVRATTLWRRSEWHRRAAVDVPGLVLAAFVE